MDWVLAIEMSRENDTCGVVGLQLGSRRVGTPTKRASRSTRNNELLNEPDCSSLCRSLFATVPRVTGQ